MNKLDLLNFAKQILEKQYPSTDSYVPTISKERQEKEIEQLKNTVKYEQFFFVLDAVNKKLEFINGVYHWLGYIENEFDMMKYLTIVHPMHLESLLISAESAFYTANKGKFKLDLMSDRVVAQIPLLNSNGQYIVCKRSLYPFQIDTKNRVTAYLNHFVILKEYTEYDNLQVTVTKGNRLVAEEEMRDYKNQLFELILNDKRLLGFTNTELKILHFRANNLDATPEELCDKVSISVNSLNKTYNHRILSKARAKFDNDNFKTLKDVVIYLKKEGIF